jgi:hypothetical protein
VQWAGIAWDGGIPSFRRKAFPEYKTSRYRFTTGDITTPIASEETEERKDFRHQQLWLMRVLSLMGVFQMYQKGFEADDLISYFVEDHRKPHLRDVLCLPKKSGATVVFSGDHDLWQLVDPRVTVLDPGKGGVVTAENFSSRAGVPSPDRWLLYRVVSGDSSDSIPGIGGVGSKRGLELARHPKPWPYCAVDLWGEEWLTQERRRLYARNRLLMDLSYSAGYVRETGMGVMLPQPDHAAAREALRALGMHSMSEDWSKWSHPFSKLVGGPYDRMS